MSHKRNDEETREDTWIGIRPSVMDARKGNKKKDRRADKQKCKNYLKYGEFNDEDEI